MVKTKKLTCLFVSLIHDSFNDPVFFEDSDQNKVARGENHGMVLDKWWYEDGYEVLQCPIQLLTSRGSRNARRI